MSSIILFSPLSPPEEKIDESLEWSARCAFLEKLPSHEGRANIVRAQKSAAIFTFVRSRSASPHFSLRGGSLDIFPASCLPIRHNGQTRLPLVKLLTLHLFFLWSHSC